MQLTERINRIQISPTSAVIAEADKLKAKGVDIADFGNTSAASVPLKLELLMAPLLVPTRPPASQPETLPVTTAALVAVMVPPAPLAPATPPTPPAAPIRAGALSTASN